MNPTTSVSGFEYFGLGAPAKPKSELDMDTFIRLLVVQLANQNPLEPMNDRDFFAQMAQLGQVQGLDKMQASLDVSQAAALMGKTVTAVNPTTQEGIAGGATVTGKVVRLRVIDGERFVGVDVGSNRIVDIQLENIREIAN